ncbi:helix-turn-helix domain-containing protein [Ammoniphilus resinae]|uniref:Transcriptional regulator with XRE-family HTH domain n=1 Tax=Ammoniphilus resinae TaxID=861532 RepID=A0ABS4GVX3_9BACL|nr:helix-turn-helix transcriptional regulator [Ammoniphilus resinae]MBP1934433.1 transcriptional regulator with XRE-family HTH domain [Ammoniphilus resinae]
MKREWLIKLRKSKKFTQNAIATKAFIDRGYYAQIEAGVRNPSFTVALNIAKVLDFDPLIFFQNLHNRTNSSQQNINLSVSDCFLNMDKAKILYLYSNLESYLQYEMTFILTGIQKASHTLIIDNKRNCRQFPILWFIL